MDTGEFIRKSTADQYRGQYSELDVETIASRTVEYWKQNSFAGKGNVFTALMKKSKEIAKGYKKLEKGRANVG